MDRMMQRPNTAISFTKKEEKKEEHALNQGSILMLLQQAIDQITPSY
jgi:hypothetical protein